MAVEVGTGVEGGRVSVIGKPEVIEHQSGGTHEQVRDALLRGGEAEWEENGGVTVEEMVDRIAASPELAEAFDGEVRSGVKGSVTALVLGALVARAMREPLNRRQMIAAAGAGVAALTLWGSGVAEGGELQKLPEGKEAEKKKLDELKKEWARKMEAKEYGKPYWSKSLNPKDSQEDKRRISYIAERAYANRDQYNFLYPSQTGASPYGPEGVKCDGRVDGRVHVFQLASERGNPSAKLPKKWLLIVTIETTQIGDNKYVDPDNPHNIQSSYESDNLVEVLEIAEHAKKVY